MTIAGEGYSALPWFVCGEPGHPANNDAWREGITIGSAPEGRRVADVCCLDTRATANARLIVTAVNALPKLVEALEGLRLFFDVEGEGSLERFERLADVFYRETGYLRPGKDCRIHDREVREAVWAKWVAAKVEAADSALASLQSKEPSNV